MLRAPKRPRKRGRPKRPPIERTRTATWARSVYVAAHAVAKVHPHELEKILGADGRWLGLWSRYDKGLVSPTPERLARIDRKLPGTRRYYDSPLWSLIENRDFTRGELREYALRLGAAFRSAFIDPAHRSGGGFWRKGSNPFDLLEDLSRYIGTENTGLDALTSILIIVREAELCQDAWLYLAALCAWATTETERARHPVLRKLSDEVLDTVVEPLRTIEFADPEVDEAWKRHVKSYCLKKQAASDNFEIIDALNRLELQYTE